MNKDAFHRRILPAAACLMALLLGAAPTAAQEQDDWKDTFPETANAAADLYDVQTPPKDWLDGPVQYIILDHERKTWRGLKTDEDRRAFIAWFWARRDLDARDTKQPVRTDFYRRVALSNERFHGFPRGWRSDRGHVWIVLGRPTGGLRRASLQGYGRCSAESGEQWTYYTQNMAFNSSLGEFSVVFVESRVGQYEICDPYMLGLGGWPEELRRALQYTNEASVFDTATEFGEESGRSAQPADTVRATVASTEPLSVPIERWGSAGVGGSVVVPLQIPLRDLLFEPVDNNLVANLVVDVTLVGMGEDSGRQGQQQWQISLDAASTGSIGGSSVRTALALPAAPGGYSANVRVVDPLSARAWVWDGAVEISRDGHAASPPLLGPDLVRLREGGEVAVITPDLPVFESGGSLYGISWVRGRIPDPEAVSAVLADADGQVYRLAGQAFWGSDAAGPLVYQATLPELASGMYTLTLAVAPDMEPVLARLKVE